VTSRTKTAVGIGTALVLLVGGFIGFRLVTRAEGEPLIDIPLVNDQPPPTCPLTGLEAENDSNLERRVLAVKIENSPEARPQMGLEEADIVYEQETEGGITRFNVLYQCRDADRIGPVRSVRPVDPAILLQYGDPLFVHSGAADAVLALVDDAGIEDIDCSLQEETCPRDDSREMPHDIFTSTDSLRDFSEEEGAAPEAAFAYDSEEPQEARRGRALNLNFSPVANVFWRYRTNRDVYVRFHDEDPHQLEDGSQVAAANVVVLLVERVDTGHTDVAGSPVPSFELIGSGDALLFRNGKVIEGTWERDSKEEAAQLVDRRGDEILLSPGTTWVELFPTDGPQPPEF
jgi:Protein of unknown function (DUF3048) N-terminal domain/Protein of unknown function (DUF3048) C-terminal domain